MIAWLPSGDCPFVLETDPGSGRVYVTHLDSPHVTVIDGTQIVNSMELEPFPPLSWWDSYPTYPRPLAVDPDTGRVYVANYYHHSITVLELQPDFNLAPVPGTWFIRSGSVTTLTVELVSQLGFSQPVTLSIDGWPAGSATLIAPNPAAPTGTAQVRVVIPAGAPLGPHTLTLRGRSCAGTRSVQYPLFVYADQDFLPVVQRTYPSTPTPVPTAWPTPTTVPTRTPWPVISSTP